MLWTKLRLLLLLVLLLLVLLRLSGLLLFVQSASASSLQVKVEEQLVVGVVRRILVVRVVASEAVGILQGVEILLGLDGIIPTLQVRAGPILFSVAALLEVKSADPFGQRDVDVVAVPLAKRIGLGSVLGYIAAGVAVGLWRSPDDNDDSSMQRGTSVDEPRTLLPVGARFTRPDRRRDQLPPRQSSAATRLAAV